MYVCKFVVCCLCIVVCFCMFCDKHFIACRLVKYLIGFPKYHTFIILYTRYHIFVSFHSHYLYRPSTRISPENCEMIGCRTTNSCWIIKKYQQVKNYVFHENIWISLAIVIFGLFWYYTRKAFILLWRQPHKISDAVVWRVIPASVPLSDPFKLLWSEFLSQFTVENLQMPVKLPDTNSAFFNIVRI